MKILTIKVLNLVINGLPSIHNTPAKQMAAKWKLEVLNLVINGLPSILGSNRCN